jgi:hypothetical protein
MTSPVIMQQQAQQGGGSERIAMTSPVVRAAR